MSLRVLCARASGVIRARAASRRGVTLLRQVYVVQTHELQHVQNDEEKVEPGRAALHPRKLARAARVRERRSERVRVAEFLCVIHPS